VQNTQLRLAQETNRPDVRWTAGIRRISGIDETTLVAAACVSLFSENRNLGEYVAQKTKLDQIEQQKQVNLCNLYHQIN
jgi:cobalt-zinc-cadmium efflux system outer membrane protein